MAAKCDVNGSFKCFNLLQDIDFAENTFCSIVFCHMFLPFLLSRKSILTKNIFAEIFLLGVTHFSTTAKLSDVSNGMTLLILPDGE
jgi:hypothetical protein